MANSYRKSKSEFDPGSEYRDDLERPSETARGFTLVTILFLAPLFLALISWLGLRLSQLVDLKKLRTECQNSLWNGQEKAGDSIQRLLGLNRLVQTLKMEEKAARSALASALATANAPLIASSRAWLASVKIRQRSVRSLQLLLIQFGENAMRSSIQAVTSDFRKIITKNSPLYNMQITGPWLQSSSSWRGISKFSLGSPQPHLAVQKKRSTTGAATAVDPFPEYELKNPFQKEQAMELRWQIDFRGKQTGVRSWIPFDLKIHDSCGITLKGGPSSEPGTQLGFGGTSKFNPVPHQDKFFWNH